MKITYKLPVKLDTNLQWKDTPVAIKVGQFEVSWDISEKNQIKSILLSIGGQKIKKHISGSIETDFLHLNKELFKAAHYLSNKIYVQTGVELLNPESVFSNSPDLFPETKDEEEELKKCSRNVSSLISTSCKIFNYLNLSDFSDGYALSEAYSFFADAKRVKSPFLQFEQIYKIVEYFFEGNGDKFDKKVSEYTEPFNCKYNQNKIKELRELRNRCIHPKAKLGHVNSEDMDAVSEIRKELPILKDLGLLLLSNPPKKKT